MSENTIPSEIKALPTDWVPNKKPSKIIEKLFTEKQQLHNKRLSSLRDDMTRIKIDTEEKILRISNKVKTCINNTKKSAEEAIKKHTFDFNKSVPHRSSYEEMYKRLKEIVIKHCNRMIIEIKKHDSMLKTIETQRMSLLKQVLNHARTDLEQISHKLPHELQIYFEEEIMNLNQIAVSNYYAYSELHSQLLNIALSSECNWLHTIDDLKNEYERKYDDYREYDPNDYEDDNDDLTIAKVKILADNISMQLFQLGGEFEGALKVIYNVLSRINEGCYDEVHVIEANFNGLPKRDYWSIYDEVYTSLFEVDSSEPSGQTEVVSEVTEVMLKRWQVVVDDITVEVEVCKKAVVEGLHIWDQHFIRQLEAADVFLLDLWNLVHQSDDLDDANFIELNKAVDVLRMCPDEDSLKQAMGECKKLVDIINKSLEKNYEKQLKFFDKFRDLMAEESGILYLEMSYFVKCMPNDDDVNPTIFRGRRSRIAIVPPEDKPLLMKQFDAEIKAMHNWLYGVNQHNKKNTDLCRDNALSFANTWIEKNSIIIYRHYSIKMSLMAELYQQIFHHVYRIRLSEVMKHEKRFNEHLLAIQMEVKKLSPFVFNETMNEFKQKAKKLNEAIKKSKNSHTTNALTKQLTAFKRQFIDEVNKIKATIDEANMKRLNELLALNVEFIKHIKFFSEDGDYNIGELVLIKKTLAKANKDLLKDKETRDKENDVKLQQSIQEVDVIEKEILDESNETNIHFAFKEFLMEHVADVHASVKEETSLLVDNNNTLSGYIERLQSLAESNVGKIEYLDDFTSNCEYMEKIFLELHGRVLQTEIFNLSDSFFKVPETDTLTDATTKGFKEDAILENIELKLGEGEGEQKQETFKVVFPAPPTGDDYMARIVRILYESLATLQGHAQEYYKKTMADNSDEEKENYETLLKHFMITHLAKYLYYQLQCDEILVEVTINYILELDELLSFMIDYYKRSMERFVNEKMNELKQSCKTYKAKIATKRQTIEEAYQLILDQLKPLHGHPKNKNLLDDLIEQLNALEDSAVGEQVEMDTLYSQFEAKIEENISTFETQVDKMETRLKQCLDNFITMYLDDECIFHQLKMKLAYFERIMNSGEAIITASNESLNIEIVDHVNSKLELLKLGLKISSAEFSLNIQTKWTKASTIKEKYSSGDYLMNSSADSLAFVVIMANFKDDQQHCLEDLITSKGILELSEFWSNIWKVNVEEVNALYSVKYAPQEEVEKIAEPEKLNKKQKKTKK